MSNPGHTPKKRHPGLQPFSRDHHHGLVQVQLLRKASKREEPIRQQAADDFIQAWQEDIKTHFDEEEQYLLSYMTEEHKKRILNEHKTLRELAQTIQSQPTSENLLTLSETLKAHIKWEENELFPTLEKSMSEDGLNDLANEINR